MSRESAPTARKRPPCWLIWVLLLSACLIGLAWIAPGFLHMDGYRALVQDAIEDETGCPVTIGRIRARLLPRARIVVEQLAIASPVGSAPGQVLRVDAVYANLALGPLVRKQVQIRSLQLIHPQVMLVQDVQSRANDQPLGSRPRSWFQTRSVPRANASAAGRFNLSMVDRMELIDAEFTLSQIRTPGAPSVPSLHAGKFNIVLTTVALDPVRPKQWIGQSGLSGVRLEVAGWKNPLEFRSGTVRLHQGQLESDFHLVMGRGLDLEGRLEVRDIEHPVTVFDLKADKLDLNALVTAGAPQGLPDLPVNRSELAAYGRVAANSVRCAPFVGTNARVELRLFGDRLEVWPLSVELYGGTVQVSLRADRTQLPERFSTNIQVRSLDVGKLLSVASPSLRGKFGGTGELNLQLFGSLGSVWRNDLAGSGRFAVRDGHLPGAEPRGALGAIATLTGMRANTPFSLIEGDVLIGTGRITNRRIHLNSPHGTIDLKGSLGLDGSLNYDGQAVLATLPGGAGAGDPFAALLGSVLKINITRASVPFTLRGTLSDPKFFSGRGSPQFETSPGDVPKRPGRPSQGKKTILDRFHRP